MATVKSGGRMSGKWILMAVALVAVVVVAGCVGEKPKEKIIEDEMYKKTEFFRGEFSPNNISLLVNQTGEINFRISPITNLQNTTIQFFLPYGVELIGGELQWNGDIKKDETLKLNITIRPTEMIRGDIKASVYTFFDKIRVKRSYYALISARSE